MASGRHSCYALHRFYQFRLTRTGEPSFCGPTPPPPRRRNAATHPVPFKSSFGILRYVCGLTPLKLAEFLPAYFLGALKATFLDAYLGSMLVGAALETDELAASSKGVLVAETCAGLPS